MHDLHAAIAAFLVLTVLVGLVRVVRGPTLPDRILFTQLFGTTATAVLLLLGSDAGAASLRDVAFIFALFASVTVIALVRTIQRRTEEE